MLDWIAEVTGAHAARRVARIQTLWSGYGEVVRIALEGGIAPTVVVKHVRPPASRTSSVSDARKRRSYDVEHAFYRTHAPRTDPATCRVARLHASRATADEWLFVLEDLDAAGFASRRADADGARTTLDACLAWLAAFHARFLGDPGADLWPEGTYWHLDTRRDELATVARVDRALFDRADALASQLASARHQTILHGDAKAANFCFGQGGVAAVDFQYVGRGCAMKDVAYFLHGHAREAHHLDTYFAHLRAHRLADHDAIEHEWRALFPIAQLDFARFLAGWRR